MQFKNIFILLLLLSFGLSLTAQEADMDLISETNSLKFRAVAELGFLAVLDHNIQFSNSGTNFDYVKEGGQDILFAVSRLSLELDVKRRNTFILLYQPLSLKTEVLLENDLIVDELTYPANSLVRTVYNFPFYRFSYLRELMPNNTRHDFAVGASIQIRNATISFESGDGTLFRSNRNVGIVPALKIRTRSQINEKLYAGVEIDGMYAPVSYLNGSDNEVVGAILDASARIGMQLAQPVDGFLNVRYLGGGAVGTSDRDDGPGDGFTRNWLSFLTVSGGFVYKFQN